MGTRLPLLSVSLLSIAFVAGSAGTSLAQAAALAGGKPAGAAAPGAPSDRTPGPGDRDYIIGPDDVLSVVFWREQQLSGDVLVRPDGKISLPLLDDIQAAGLTPVELRDRLTVEARRYITDPIATVVVRQINSRKVYITGQVMRPGQYPMTPSMTVLQLIATAGGLQEYAKSRDIRVVRTERGRDVTLRFDYEQTTKRDDPARNLELKAGDTVIVP